MYDVSVWTLKLEIGFLPLFLRSFAAICCFLGLSRSYGLVFRHLVLRRAAAGIVASGFTVVCRWPSSGCRLCVTMRCVLLVVVPWGCMARSTESFGFLNHLLMFCMMSR